MKKQHLIEFTQIFEGIECDCLEGSSEDSSNTYALKTIKEELRIQDFNSYHDKGKENKKLDCNSICSFRGVSVSLFNDKSKDYVLKVYQELFPLSPKYKPYVKIVKFSKSCGNLKHTPSIKNDFHYDFYKSNIFTLDKIKVIEVKELHNV